MTPDDYQLKYQTMQDFLLAQGFQVDHQGEAFFKPTGFGYAWHIPFHDLSGKTVRELALRGQKEGWLS